MILSNKKSGNDFESYLAKKLVEYGFWVHLIVPNPFGQPADIIALRDGHSWLIDAKDCKNNKFPLSRVEENQIYAMKKFSSRGGISCFTLGMSGETYMISLPAMLQFRETQKTLTLDDVKHFKTFDLVFKEY